MSNSRRYELVAALRTRLAYITIDHGYRTDAGEHIFMGEAPRFGPDDPPAALAISVGATSNEQTSGSFITYDLTIEIQAQVPVDLAEPLLAMEDMIADIRTAVEVEGHNPAPNTGDASVDRSMDALATPKGFRRGSTRPLMRPDGSGYAGMSCEYVASFQEKWGEP